MINLFNRIRATIYDPAFYASARMKDLSQPIKLTAVVAVIGALLGAAVMYAFIVPLAFLPVFDKAEAAYPDDLIIKLQNGDVTINQEEPYYIENNLFDEGPEHLVIFDGGDTLEGTASQNDALVLVKRTHLIASSDDDERMIDFKKFGTTTVTITKEDVRGFLAGVEPYYKPVLLIGGFFAVLVGALFAGFFWVIFHLIYLVIIPAPAVWIYARFRTPQLSFKEAYITVVYASIPVAILTFIIGLLGFNWPPFVYSLVVVLIALINIARQPESTSHEEVPTSSEN